MLHQITKEGNALLNAIRNSESSTGDNAYKMRYSPKGGKTFNDYSKHPRIYESVPWRTDGKKSDAAGAYQFLSSTFNPLAAKYGISDFSPESQDKAAWILAQENYQNKTGNDLQQDLEAGKVGNVFNALSGTWTSLPGGSEKNALTSKAKQTYDKTLNHGFYGSVRKAGCTTRNAVLSTVPFLDYKPIDCEQDARDNTIDPADPLKGVLGDYDSIFIRIGVGLSGALLLGIGLVKMKI